VINSPYDLDARYGKKRSTLWVGYKIHFSETCDDDAPQLITHVETTRAGINDEKALPAIHAGLDGKDLLPDQHLVDAGYIDAANLLQSRQQYEVDLLGPVRHN
jgi:transposase